MNIIKAVRADYSVPEDVATFGALEGVFENVTRAVLGLAAITLFILLVWGGFKYITSGGDPKAAEDARKTLTYAIGGMVLIALAILILRLIEAFTGIDVTQFRIFQ